MLYLFYHNLGLKCFEKTQSIARTEADLTPESYLVLALIKAWFSLREDKSSAQVKTNASTK